jgi:DNA polymerase-3 subunit beta
MKFTFTQSSILKGIQKVIGAVAARAAMPALTNFHLKLDGRQLLITATDLEVTVSATVELLESQGSGGVLVQAKRLHDLIRELPDIPLEFEVQDPFKVTLKGDGVGVYNLPGEDPLDFPELPVVDSKISFKLPAETFKRMIGKTLFAVSKDEMRPVLTGIYFQLRPNEVRVVATDGHRLSRVSRQDVSFTGESRDEIIPMKALNLLQRNLEDSEELEIALAETRASFSTSGLRLITRLIDGHFPKYENVIPTNNPNRLNIKLSDFMSTVRRVSIFSSHISRQLKLTFNDGRASIEAEDPEYGGRGREELVVDYEGEMLEIAYNATYLMDALRQVDTEDAVFALGSSNDAAVIRPSSQADHEDFLMLLMPIRLR